MKIGNPIWRFGYFRNSQLAGIAQVAYIQAKRGSFLHVRHGPVLRTVSKELLAFVIRSLKDIAREKRAAYIRTSPLIPDTEVNRKLFLGIGCIPSAIHAMDGELCWVLDITKSDNTLFSEMRKTTRYEIRRGQRFGVTVKKSENTRDLDIFFYLYRQTSLRHGFVQHTGIKEEVETFLKQKKAILLFGIHNSEVIACAIILFYGNQAIFHHGASKISKVPASYCVQWEAIREARRRGMKLYNFWGIAPDGVPNHPWSGLTLFKKGFGGHEVRYIHAQDIPLSKVYIFTRAVEQTRKILRGY